MLACGTKHLLVLLLQNLIVALCIHFQSMIEETFMRSKCCMVDLASTDLNSAK